MSRATPEDDRANPGARAISVERQQLKTRIRDLPAGRSGEAIEVFVQTCRHSMRGCGYPTNRLLGVEVELDDGSLTGLEVAIAPGIAGLSTKNGEPEAQQERHLLAS